MSLGTAVTIALLVGIAIGVVAIYFLQQNRTRRLKEHFGPEYTRLIKQTGNRSAAEKLEQQWHPGESASTEDLRLALRRYRSFFERLLSI